MNDAAHLIMLGIHQRTTSLPMRERFAFAEVSLPSALHTLHTLRPHIAEGVILATCNRVEVYANVHDHAEGVQAIQAFLAAWHHVPIETVREVFTTSADDAVVRQLFRLAAGLDSTVVGEDQIVGQLKRAHAAAKEAEAAGKILNRLVSGALAASKRVRTQTGIASHPVSVVSVALNLVQREIGDLTAQRCLVVGAGRIAELALKLLRAKHVRSIMVTSRTSAHAHRLAERYGAETRPVESLPELLAACTLIICATAAPSYVFPADATRQSVIGHARIFLDLSVPRGIDPRGSDQTGDRLFDIDALQTISERNHLARTAEIATAEALVEAEVRGFSAWLAQQAITPTIRALQRKAETIRDAEVRRTLARLPDLAPHEQELVRYLGAAIVNKLLHRPLVALKDPDHGPEVAALLGRIFQLEKEMP